MRSIIFAIAFLFIATLGYGLDTDFDVGEDTYVESIDANFHMEETKVETKKNSTGVACLSFANHQEEGNSGGLQDIIPDGSVFLNYNKTEGGNFRRKSDRSNTNLYSEILCD